MSGIGIFESGAHVQYLHSICRIAQETGHPVTVFVKQETYEVVRDGNILDVEEFDWVIKKPEERTRSFRKRVEESTRSLDATILLSVYGGPIEMAEYGSMSVDSPTIMFTYNIGRWLKTGIRPSKGLKNNIYRILHRRIVDKVDAIAVEYPHFRPYVQQRFPDWGVPVFVFAPVVADERETTGSDDRFVVSVPGNVDEARRDYDLLLDAIEECAEYSPGAFQLRLLGPPRGSYGEGIMRRCARLVNRGIDIKTFDEWIDFPEFRQFMRESDLLVSPLQYVIPNHTGGSELFGVTKGSGSAFDAIRHAVPPVYPDYFHVPYYLREEALSFRTSSDLSTTIADLIDDPNRYDRLHSGMKQVSSQFTLEKQATRFNEIISDLRDSTDQETNL